MKKKIIGVMILISFGLCEKSFSCTTSGTTYSMALNNITTYYCAKDKYWDSTLWCPSSNDSGQCGGANAGSACYSGGPIYGSTNCLPTNSDYLN